MNTLARIFVLLALVTAVACSKDRSGENQQDKPLTEDEKTLAQYLDGRFNVSAIDYDGTLSAGPLSAPLDSMGKGGSGYYIFRSADAEVDYSVVGTVKFSLLGSSQSVEVPIAATGSFEVLSETRFSITDPDQGKSIFDVKSRNGKNLVFETDIEQQTQLGTASMDMEIHVTKE